MIVLYLQKLEILYELWQGWKFVINLRGDFSFLTFESLKC